MAPETTTRAGLALLLWQATQTDAALLTNLRTAYRGRPDLQDALWWRAHPLVATPGGHADPAVALRPLQEAVYSRVADSQQAHAGAAEKSEQLRALTAQLARDAAELDAVFDLYTDWARGPGEFPAPAAQAARAPSSPAVAAATRAPPTPPAHRPRPLLLVALGAVLGVCGTFGVQAIRGQPPATDAGTSSPAQASSTPPATGEPIIAGSAGAGNADSGNADSGNAGTRAGGAVTKYLDAGTSSGAGQDSGSGGTGDVFEIFYHPAVFTDGVVPQLGRDVQPESIRAILFGPDDPGYRIYAAYTSTGTTCLFLKHDVDETFSACAPAAQLQRDGLRLDTMLRALLPGMNTPATVAVQVRWEPNGSFSTTTRPGG
jgi:hypothetical protein